MLTIKKAYMKIHKGAFIEVVCGDSQKVQLPLVQNCYKMINVKELFINHVSREEKRMKKRMFRHGAMFLPAFHD